MLFTLFIGVSLEKPNYAVVKALLDLAGYCPMQFPATREDTLNRTQLVLGESSGCRHHQVKCVRVMDNLN